MRRLVRSVAISLAAASSLSAQGWRQLPDLSWVYDMNLQTTATLACGSFYATGSCAQAGNAVRLTNGTASLLVTFTGISQPLTITPFGQTSLSLGNFVLTPEGAGPFVLPTLLSDGARLFSATLTVSSASPIASSAPFAVFELPEVTTYFPNVFSLALAPSPANVKYVDLWGDFSVDHITATSSTLGIRANVSLVPEPGTLALVAGGLIGVAATARRRRR